MVQKKPAKPSPIEPPAQKKSTQKKEYFFKVGKLSLYMRPRLKDGKKLLCFAKGRSAMEVALNKEELESLGKAFLKAAKA